MDIHDKNCQKIYATKKTPAKQIKIELWVNEYSFLLYKFTFCLIVLYALLLTLAGPRN